jgi:hypothetical protein
MTKSMFVLAAALALPLQSPTFAQQPAQIDVEALQAIPGTWTYRAIAGGSEADFIDTAAAVRMVVRCDRSARTVSIVRTGVPAAAPTLSIWTSSKDESVPSRYLSTKDLVADLAASDPLLDAIAFSRGRFATAAEGAPLIAVPAWSEPARVIEDCRS